MIGYDSRRKSRSTTGQRHCVLLVGLMFATGICSAQASISEDNWQSLERWEQGGEPGAATVAAPSAPAAKLLPSLGSAPVAEATTPAAAAVAHKVDFAGLPPLFERPIAVAPGQSKEPKPKAPATKPLPALSEKTALTGRENELRGLALTLPGPEKAPVVAPATTCAKPQTSAIDPRLASDRATLAALQSAVKSVGAEQAFDFMLPAKTETSPALTPSAGTSIPELRLLNLPALP